MREISFPSENIEKIPRAVALGFFDGVHLGHRAVLFRLQADAALRPAVFTFADLPKARRAGRLLTAADTAARLQACGVQEVFSADFDAVRDLSPEEFVRDVLCGQLCARAVVCGFNYRFGAGGEGDAAALCQLGAKYGVQVTVVPPVPVDGEPVSSTRIRAAVRAGDMAGANRLLGAPLTIHSTVIGGQQLGRTLGTPTINQPLDEGLVLPAFGVYASAVEVDGHVLAGVTNIGVRPTVGGDTPLAETWIPDFAGDLYGQAVPVRPVKFLRAERPFPSVEALRAQIHADGEAACRLLNESSGERAVLFDFDDTLQDRPAAFLAFSRHFVAQHFPDLSAPKREAMAREMARLNGDGYVSYPRFLDEVKAAFAWQNAPDNETLLAEVQREFPLFTTLLPGVTEGLTALRERGYRLGIVTNGYSAMQNKKLDVSGLRPLLDTVVVSGDEGVHKPNPEIFRRAAARMGVACADCVFVGDHPVNDIAGAVDAGMRPVFMQASGAFPPPDNLPIVHSMAEFLRWIAQNG